MQVIAAILVLLSFAEAGLIAKAPRTESPDPAASDMFIITSSPAASTVTASPPLPLTTSTQASITPGGAIYGTAVGNSGNPEPTPAPNYDLGSPGAEPLRVTDGIKFVQTTYWACESLPFETHCGWHMPILDTSAASLNIAGQGTALRAGIAAACVGVALLYGF
ncbi:hypothetical protein GGR51DRAFT_529062 [Nemania sp. FL0031]|nr:hypothetical protein GGR51DRAFT_529062 [Nemania sp. FL0031]